MSSLQKTIRLSGHAVDQLRFRGCTQEEIEMAISTEKWKEARGNRFECRKEFAFDNIWNGKKYARKQVRPIFVEEEKEIVVVTVYTYYL